MTELGDVFTAEVVTAIERLVDERVEARVAELHAVDDSPWMSLAVAAKYLGISTKALGNHRKSGSIRESKLGRRVLVHRDDLDAFARGVNGGEGGR